MDDDHCMATFSLTNSARRSRRISLIVSSVAVALAAMLLLVPTGRSSPTDDDRPVFIPTDTMRTDPGALASIENCRTCHRSADRIVGEEPSHPYNRYLSMSYAEASIYANVGQRCATCHGVVDPALVSVERWTDVMYHMKDVFRMKEWPVSFAEEEWLDLLHFYVAFAPKYENLPPDAMTGTRVFSMRDIGRAMTRSELPMIGNVSVVDLDQNGEPEILATDFIAKGVVHLTRGKDGVWSERLLNRGAIPAKTEVIDFEGDGDLDIVLANIGSPYPSEAMVGSIDLLINDGTGRFASRQILDSVGRLSDARPADLDNDGDLDIAVTVFGFLNVGEVGWLEQVDTFEFVYHRLTKKNGGLHIIPTDLDGDGLLDLLALITQEHEEIVAFMNQGDGAFRPEILYKAPGPTWGFSGIELVDLDGDGDEDILATNGDAIDLPNGMVLPYHGIQWFENRGKLDYVRHGIVSFYGAYRAVPGDLDGDGDLDIVAVTMISDWNDPNRMSAIWLENDGTTTFTPHGVGNDRTYLMSCDLGDLDGDGDLDIVAGGMNVVPDPFGRIGRIVLIDNLGTSSDTSRR